MRRRKSEDHPQRNTLVDRLRASVSEIDAARLQERFAGLELTSIGDSPERVPVRVGGEVRAHHLAASTNTPSLEVEISDGTGTAVAHFSGRRKLGGLEPGRAVVIEGVGRRIGTRLVVRDPAYTLLP